MFRAVHGVPGNQCLLSPVAAVSTGEIRQSNNSIYRGRMHPRSRQSWRRGGRRALRLWSNQREGAAQRLRCTSLREDERVPGVRPQRDCCPQVAAGAR